MARAVRAEQKMIPQPAGTDATVIDFDADIGQDVIQLSDGSIRYATPLASGVRGAGDTVLIHQSGAAYSDALPHIKKRVSGRPRKVPQVSYPFKILFSVVEDGIQKFYVGGDRKEPKLIFKLDTNKYFAVDPDTARDPFDQTFISGFISNTGEKSDDWIVGIKYAENRFDLPEFSGAFGDNVHYLTVITSKSITTFSDIQPEQRGIGTLGWKGAGVWMTRADLAMDLTYYSFQDLFGRRTSENYQIIEELRPGTPPAPTIKVVNPEDWYPITNPKKPPFPIPANYTFSSSDHTGLKDLVNRFNFNTLELWDYSATRNSRHIYAARSDSYQRGSTIVDPYSRISTTASTFHLNGLNYNSYLITNASSFYREGGTQGLADFDSFYQHVVTSGGDTFAYDNAIRKNLVVDQDLLIPVEAFDFKYTTGTFSGFRSSNGVTFDAKQRWSRFIRYLDVKGYTYFMPGKMSPIVSISSAPYDRLNNDDFFQIKYDQSFIESVAIDCKLKGSLIQTCEAEEISIGEFSPQRLIPDNIKYSIYDKKTDVLLPVVLSQTNFSFSHKIDTFFSNGGKYKIVSVKSSLDNLKTQNVNLEYNEQAFEKANGSYSLSNGTSKNQKLFSLKINTNLTHYVHNISFFST